VEARHLRLDERRSCGVERYQRELPGRLDRRTRLDILRLKDVWHARPEYPEIVGGYDIRTGVLEHGVRTPAELEAYLTGRPRPASG
jgi:hypothetical protein